MVADNPDSPVLDDSVAEKKAADAQSDARAQPVQNEPGADTGHGQGGEQVTEETSDSAQAESGDSGVDGELAAQMDALQEQLAAAKDQALRDQAEMQNIRRRAERDVEQAHKYGVEKLVNSLLPVLDNLDRAIDAANTDAADRSAVVESVVEGLELTRKSALGALQSFAVEALEPVGEPFDPQVHEAMTMVPSPTAEPNTVIDVLQKGYTLNGRVIRAAMVVVAKAP